MDTKIIFDFAKSQITIEGAEAQLLKLIGAVKEMAPSLGEIRILAAKEPQLNPSPGGENGMGGAPAGERKQGVREFAKKLQLANAYERIAALTYWANKIDKQDTVSVKQIDDWFGLCGFQKPSAMSVAIFDSKRKYDYLTSKGRDKWAITTAGENLIIGKLESGG